MSQIAFRKALSCMLASGACLTLAAMTSPQIHAQVAPAPGPRPLPNRRGPARPQPRPRHRPGRHLSRRQTARMDRRRPRRPEIASLPSTSAKAERVTAATSSDQHCREARSPGRPIRKASPSSPTAPAPTAPDRPLPLQARWNSRETPDQPQRTSPSPRIFARRHKIAFLYVEGATRPAGALAAMKPPSGVIGEDGVEIQRVACRPT